MEEVTAPVIAVALVLCAVFVPCAFITGVPGQFYRQFAVTISASTVISAINSLTLSPALAAILLRPQGTVGDPLDRLLGLLLGWFFRLFERAFERTTRVYVRIVGWLLRWAPAALAIYAALLVATWWLVSHWPLGFIPQQDQGRLIVSVQLPDAAALERTEAAIARLDEISRSTPGVQHTVTMSGNSIVSQSTSPNFGTMFLVLDDFAHRRSSELSADAIADTLRKRFAAEVREATTAVFGAAPVPGVGVAGGFKLMVEDRGSLGPQILEKQTNRLIADLSTGKGLAGVMTQFNSDTPQLFMDIDRTKVRTMGILLADVNQALQIFLGSYYVNSFNAFGRFWQVNLMADGAFRNHVDDIRLIKVRNNQGNMAPLSSLVELRDMSGPVMINRYNLYLAAPVNGVVLPTTSSGEAIETAEAAARDVLPRSMATEWTELTLLQVRAGNTAMYVFALSVVFVFLALAALYESWSLPLAVILVVPLCILCSVAGVAATGTSINIFVQIGLVVLVALACKNAILIVEFAKRLRLSGRSIRDATLEASHLRLRPIVMTSLAFILGVVPLVVARGAGAEMRRSLGTAVFSGMLGVTAFGIFLTPVFFLLIETAGETAGRAQAMLRRAGSMLFGIGTGLVLGWLAWRVGFRNLRWALILGGGLGMLVAVAMQMLAERRHWQWWRHEPPDTTREKRP